MPQPYYAPGSLDILSRILPLVSHDDVVVSISKSKGKITLVHDLPASGVGFILDYKGEVYLVSVAHVIESCDHAPLVALSTDAKEQPLKDAMEIQVYDKNDPNTVQPIVAESILVKGFIPIRLEERVIHDVDLDIAIWKMGCEQWQSADPISIGTRGGLYGAPAYALGFPAPMTRENYGHINGRYIPFPASLTFYLGEDVKNSEVQYMMGYVNAGFSGAPIFVWKGEWTWAGVVSNYPTLDPRNESDHPGLVGYVTAMAITNRIDEYLDKQSEGEDKRRNCEFD